MSFNNRCVCKINTQYSLDEIINNIEEESFFEIEGKENTLKHKIEIKGRYNENNLNFIYGKYGFEMETEAVTPEIRPERIIDVGDIIIVTTVLSFWITDNGLVLFTTLNNSYNKKGKSTLSERLFGASDIIEEKHFDIESINEDIETGELNGMWTSSFSGRNSNVRGGTLNGTNVNEDAMFNLTQGTSKTGTGITHEVNNEEIKIKFYESGTIQLLTRELEMMDPTIFKLLGEFEKYII